MSSLCAQRKLSNVKIRGRDRQSDRATPAPSEGDELRELAETFRITVHRLSSLVRELEAAHEHALRAEEEKKQFYREVIRTVTHGKFELVECAEIPQVGREVVDLPVTNGSQFAGVRKAIHNAATNAGMPEERVTDLVLAAAEALGNALKHAVDGRCQVFVAEDGVRVRISDRGSGIASHFLPAAILKPGFSTKVSLGMGYKMMLDLVDRVWLNTSETGTIVQLDQGFVPSPPQGGNPLLDAMKRM